MSSYRDILHPTDFSPASQLALTRALELATLTGARLHLLHVVEDPVYQPWMMEPYAVDFRDVLEQSRTDGEARLNRMAAGHAGPTATCCLIGRPIDAILEYARAQRIDLIVMGSHGQGAVTRFLLGSVAERVVRHSDCPVLTVREPRAPEVTARDAGGAPLAATG